MAWPFIFKAAKEEAPRWKRASESAIRRSESGMLEKSSFERAHKTLMRSSALAYHLSQNLQLWDKTCPRVGGVDCTEELTTFSVSTKHALIDYAGFGANGF